LHRLALVVEMIATLEAERDTIVEDQASTHVNAEKALHKLKAIGPEFAAVLVGEIFHRDFNNRRQLASYVGTRRARFRAETWRMTKGSARPATARGEPPDRLAVAALSTRQRFERLVSSACRTVKGRIRRIAIVALARKLLVALWRYLETGLVPRGAVFKG
jgi:transposase